MVETLSCKPKDSVSISTSGSFFFYFFLSKVAYYNVSLKKSLQQRDYEIEAFDLLQVRVERTCEPWT